MKKKIIGMILSLSLCLQSGIIYAKDTISLPITAYEQENGITDIEMFEYQHGATFGARVTPKELSKWDIDSREYFHDWANTQDIFYYQDQEGMLHIVHCEEKQLKDVKLDENYQVIDTVTIKTELPMVGGFYYDPKGIFYVVSGQINEEEDPNKIVIVIEKFDQTWVLKGSTKIKGNYEHLFEGIIDPFSYGSCRMEIYGEYLIVHTARRMFVHEDGLNHQSNLCFVINTEAMTPIDSPKTPYVSHSLNQFVVADEDGNMYYLNHGDAYPRAIELSKYSGWTAPSELGKYRNQEGRKLGIFPFINREKEHYSYTGCIVTGFEKIGNQLITVGASIPQDRTQSENGKDFRNKNVFVIYTDKYLNQSKSIWLTDYNPTTLQYEVTEPKLIKVNEERFIILYGVKQKDTYILCYRELDNNGNVLEAIDYKDVALIGNSQPLFDGKRIFWLGYDRERSWEEKVKVLLHSIPYGKIPIEQMDKEKDEITIKEGESYTLAPALTPNLPEHLADIVWRSEDEQTATVKNGILTGGFYGKTTLVGTLGNKKIQYDVEVQYDANNKPLGQIQLKTKSLKGNQFQFEWKPVKGAYGYEIYKRQKNGTYKKIKTLNARTTKCVVQRQKTDKKYSYKIRAYGMKANGQMKYSKWVEKTNDKKKSVKKTKKTVTRKKK